MSYQVLARKWRPAKFEQVVGQSHVLHALTNALTQQRLHHAYLFSGTRGVGKTSLARLFAKGLNCEQGVSAQPCGQCASCVEIAQGRFVDLIEVDAASRTKVDDTRELLDNVQYRPSRGRYKVYLIDEVHMLSRSSFNALLKTLEEPPEHVKFLLATTDPQKLPITVLSRCLQFNLKSIAHEDIVTQLSHVLSQETIHFEEQALTLIAKSANGSMRDALSLTDQAIAFGAGQVMLSQVQTMLGSIDEHHVIHLLKALVSGDIAQLMQMVYEILSFGADADEVLRSLLELLHQITLTQFAPAAAQLSLNSEKILTFSHELDAEQVQLYYQILLAGRKELIHAPDPKSGLEMALLRAVTFVPETPITRWKKENTSSNEKDKAVTDRMEADSLQVNRTDDPSLGHKLTIDDGQVSLDALEQEQMPADLRAEMALIMSQAQSQGQTQGHSQDQFQNISVEASSVEPIVMEPMGNESMEQAQGQTQGQSQGHSQDISVEASSVEPIVMEPMGNESMQQAQGQSQGIDVEPIAMEPMNNEQIGQAQNVSDGSYALEAEMTGIIHEAMAQGGAEQTVRPLSYTDVSSSPTAVSMPVVEDDILDAVLAARDSLLAPVDEDKGGSETGKKLTIAHSKLTNTTEKAAALPDHNTCVVAKKDSEGVIDNSEEDRPPWEVAPANINRSPELLSQEADTPASAVSSERSCRLQRTDVQAVSPTEMKSSESESVPVSKPLKTPLSGDERDLLWYKFMASLEVGGRVRQLAVNSVCLQFSQTVHLKLKPDQKHLCADIAILQLEEAITQSVGQAVQLSVEIGSDLSRETPLEVRKRFHKELLNDAAQTLEQDENIQWLMQNMQAQVQHETLAYAPPLLAEKSNEIALLTLGDFDKLIVA
ncbi:DNA polymerase III subunit gamma/tau [uncultured Shewanella sp.]|uniref:DNA polymerase III subunit gamma/tau n=1 Tax=uncultured Shewanella sp. TaxID=173975 RepID=UPI00260DF775|nr:DNA polymerase III subunit gamma/tau [uncultured Shewanella sp.]